MKKRMFNEFNTVANYGNDFTVDYLELAYANLGLGLGYEPADTKKKFRCKQFLSGFKL